ncbi:MAG: alpha/beta hydrolase [Dehalococcoidia bacterium]|nr:alpha/beta hydrolase [Dehalococcoidia bacterium]
MVGARPETFPSLDAAVEYLLASMPAWRLDQFSRAEHVKSISHGFRQLPNGTWTWKHDPALVRQRVQSGPPPRPSLWPVLQRIHCPALVVWGVESDVLSEQQARRMVATLPKSELLPVPNVGHAPTLMEPSVSAALERFLSGAPPKQVEKRRVSRPA